MWLGCWSTASSSANQQPWRGVLCECDQQQWRAREEWWFCQCRITKHSAQIVLPRVPVFQSRWPWAYQWWCSATAAACVTDAMRHQWTVWRPRLSVHCTNVSICQSRSQVTPSGICQSAVRHAPAMPECHDRFNVCCGKWCRLYSRTAEICTWSGGGVLYCQWHDKVNLNVRTLALDTQFKGCGFLSLRKCEAGDQEWMRFSGWIFSQRGLLLQMSICSMVCVSLCMSVCWSWLWARQKWLSQFRCCLGPKEPSIRRGHVRVPLGKYDWTICDWLWCRLLPLL